jgi:hypothetical protein
VLIAKFAIASEGCVPAPAKASLPSMARLTQFVYSPCGNSEGMVNHFDLSVGWQPHDCHQHLKFNNWIMDKYLFLKCTQHKVEVWYVVFRQLLKTHCRKA